MKKLFFAGTLLLVFGTGYSQSILEEIKNEYYRVNSSNAFFEKVTISDTEYYLEKGKVKKVKSYNELGTNEFYYNYNSVYGEYKVFFIYFRPDEKSGLPEFRLYFNENESVFLYKENTVEKSFFKAKPYSNQLALKSKNAINKFSNIFLESRDQYGQEKLYVDSLFQVIEKSQLTKIDSAKNIYIEKESQSFNEGKSVFINSENEIVKTFELQGDGHGSIKQIDYFYDGKLILRISESEHHINGFQYSLNKEYYTREHSKRVMFRREMYKNYEAKLESSLLNIEPCIEIKKRR